MTNIVKPSMEQVKIWTKKWEIYPQFSSYKIQEKILQNLFRAYPTNHSLSEVEVKVKTLNLYYSTNVKAVNTMAKHIIKIKNLDELLAKGNPSAVTKIAKLTWQTDKGTSQERHNYSFATKYCSFHNPAAYPIYDSYVKDLLYRFNKKYQFYSHKLTKTSLQNFENYEDYKEIINIFRNKFLLDISYKELDRYLWTMGKINAKKRK